MLCIFTLMETQTTNINITNNASDAFGEGEEMLYPLWISTLIINFSLIAISLWFVLTVLVYGYKSGKFTRKRKADYSGGIIMKLLFAATVLVLPRFIFTNVITWIGFDVGTRGDFECEVAVDISIAAYYFALLPAYFFLWARQRCLYKQPSISRLYNSFVKVLNWGSIMILNLTGICILILFILPLAYKSSPNGCVLREEEEDNVIGLLVLPVVLMFGQLLLLGLFIYPLCRHKCIQVSSFKKKELDKELPSEQSFSNRVKPSLSIEGITSRESPILYKQSTQCSCRTSRLSLGMKRIKIDRLSQLRLSTFSLQSRKQKRKSSMKTKARLITVMRRSVICAVICIVSDLVATLAVSVLLPRETPKSFTNTCFDISLLINIVALIFSFESYKGIFKAPCLTFSILKMSSLNTYKSSSLANDE